MRQDPRHAAEYLANTTRTELDAALLVAQLIADDVDGVSVRATLDAMAATATIVGVEELARHIDRLGFAGAQQYYALENSRIDRVLVTRRGIPITLAVVYIELGRRAGMDVYGVGFPGHFLVEANGTLVDPFEHRVLTDAAFAELSARHPGVEAVRLRARATPDEMALRMINNVKGVVLAGSGDQAVADVLGLIDAQIALGGDPTSLHLERAELWRRLRSLPGMRSALEDARSTCKDADLAKEIDRRLAALPADRDGGVH